MRGKFFGVSVGPGDPELMTFKAVRIIEDCSVLAVPRTENGQSVALNIASQVVDVEPKEIIYLDFLMSRDKEKVAARHQDLATLIAERLEAGKQVAMLNLGDASLYATYSYIQRILQNQGYETKTIPGVTSFCACAAKLGVSLTSARLPLYIIPGDYPDLKQVLAAEGTKVIMKQGKGIERVKEALQHTGQYGKAKMVENCGREGEKVYHSLDEAGTAYFSTILVGGEDN